MLKNRNEKVINKIGLQHRSSFVNFGLQGWLAAVCKCAVLWAGFLSSFLWGGRKKQNKFPESALNYQRATNKSVRLFYNIYRQMSMFGRQLHLQLTVSICSCKGF
jgi:hypothetical protein